MYGSSPFRSTLNTGIHHSFGHVWSMYRSSPFRSTLNTGIHHSFGHVWSMYRSSPFRSTLNTGYITALDNHSFGHVWSMYRSSPFRSTLNTGLHYRFGHVWSMYRSSPFRSTLNTGYITALDMCDVCTEAVHSVAPWTRVTSQLWTSVKYEPPSDTFVHISTTLTRFCVSRTILRLHFRGAWFGNSTTLPRLYLWHPANSTTLTRAPNQPGAKNNNHVFCQFFCSLKIYENMIPTSFWES